MINVKEAATIAMESFAEFYGDQFKNVMFEEMEQKGDSWYITVGYDLPSIFPQFGGKVPRGFKVFEIDITTGKVLSMKIRVVD